MAIDLREFIEHVMSLPSKKKQVLMMHEHGFPNEDIALITGSTRNSVDWYISKGKNEKSQVADRAAFEADKTLTSLRNVELKRDSNANNT